MQELADRRSGRVRGGIELEAEIIICAMILDRNLLFCFNERMETEGLTRTTRARRRARGLSQT
jgi:hypothetical protein